MSQYLQVIRVWARILGSLPSARLLLKNKPFACESARSHTLGLLAAEVCPNALALEQRKTGAGHYTLKILN